MLRKRRKTSISWNYFTANEDGSNAKCNLCSLELKTTGGCTSSMGRHLLKYHNEITNEESRRVVNVQTTVKPEEVVSKLAAEDGITFNVIATSRTLREIFLRAYGVTLPSSPVTIREWVVKASGEGKTVLANEIQLFKTNAKKLSVTLDEWTSAANHRYMSVVVHAGGAKFWNLGLVRIRGSFTAEECLSLLSSKLHEFKIDLYQDVFGIVTDGAAVMRRFGAISGRKQQLCIAHGIHLAVSDVLYSEGRIENQVNLTLESNTEQEDNEENSDESSDEDEDFDYEININELISKVRKIVKSFRKSSRKAEVLQSYSGIGSTLLIDTKTRWNSLYVMLERFISLKDGILKTLIDFNESSTLSEGDFRTIEGIIKVLQPVKVTVDFLCKRDATLITADAAIQIMMSEISEETSELGLRLFAALKKRILERRTSLSEVLTFIHFKKIVDNPGHAAGYFTKLSYQQLATSIKKLHEDFHQVTAEEVESETESMEMSQSQSLLFEVSLLEKFKNAINLATCGTVEGETRTVSRQVRDPSAALLTSVKKEMSELERWKVRGPILTGLYESLLTIPPCSVESERVFSAANNFCRKIRSRLSDRSLDALVFLKSYFKNCA